MKGCGLAVSDRISKSELVSVNGRELTNCCCSKFLFGIWGGRRREFHLLVEFTAKLELLLVVGQMHERL